MQEEGACISGVIAQSGNLQLVLDQGNKHNLFELCLVSMAYIFMVLTANNLVFPPSKVFMALLLFLVALRTSNGGGLI